MTKLDVLNSAAVALPTILALVGIVVSIEEIKTKSKRDRALWWGGLLVLGIGTSVVVLWQQTESGAAARNQAQRDIAAATTAATAPLNAKLDGQKEQLKTILAAVLRSAAPAAPVVAGGLTKPSLRTAAHAKNTQTETIQAPPSSPPVAGISFVQRDVVSTDPSEPYETQVIIQTTQTINNASFGIATDGAIDDGKFFVTGQGAMMNVGYGVIKNRRGFVLRFGYPAFTSDAPIVVTLHAKAPFRVTQVVDLRGQQ